MIPKPPYATTTQTGADGVYEDPKGRIDVGVPREAVLLVRMVRHASGGFVGPVVKVGDGALRVFPKISVFFDLGDLSSYDSAARIGITDWLVHNKARFTATHVFTRSKLVGMGVAVANLALGGFMKVHARYEPFERAFDAREARRPPA